MSPTLSSPTLFGETPVAIFDLSNVVARALSIAGENSLGLFVKMLLGYRQAFANHDFVFCIEGRGAANRRHLDPTYKADKTVPTKEFNDARAAAGRLLCYTNALIVQAPDGEADDAIATYVKQRCSGTDVVIISNDRDLWQLITKRVKAYAKVKKKEILIDRHICQQELGVPPAQLHLLKTLLGDPSDKIPRAVPRMKTATIQRLVTEAQTLEKIPSTARAATWMTEKEREKLLAAKSRAILNYQLIKLQDELLLKIQRGTPNAVRIKEILDKRRVSLDNLDVNNLIGA